MRYIGIGLILLFFITNLFGCVSKPHIPRKSFVKITAKLQSKKCDSEELCMYNYLSSAASGSIVKHSDSTLILTAGHVCDLDDMKREIGVKHLKVKYRVLDANGITHKAKVLKLDKENDICVLKIKRIHLPIINLRFSPPERWEKLYNLAGPVGFADKNYVPLLEGRYSGFNTYRMIFTIPAAGGSSGSPVFDHNGDMVGMIIAVHRAFPMISFSPHFHALEEMIDSL